MPWPGVTIGVALCLFAICHSPLCTQAEENVGCLFSERLCLEDEWCYDDMAFGRCLKPMGDVDEDDLFRYELEREGLHELSSELRRLFALGYRWSHGYTQCRLQAMLYAFKNDLTFEPNSCSHLSDNDLEGALKALEGQVDLDPREVAIIKYTPSEDDPHAAFADEVYYPPINNNREQEEMRQKILAPNAIELDIPDPYADYTIRKRAWIPQRRWVAARPYHFESRKRNVRPDALEFLQKYDNDIPSEDFRRRNRPLSLDEMIEMYPEVKWLSDLNLTPAEIEMLVSPENYEKLSMLLQRFDQELVKGTYDVEAILKQQLEAEKELENLQKVDPDDFPEMIDDYLKNRRDDSKGTIPLETNIFGNKKFRHLDVDRKLLDRLGEENEESDSADNDEKPKFYAEGGVVWTDLVDPKDDDAERILENNLDKIFGKYNNGFKRPERLDVKKPGPPFDAQISDTSKQSIAEKKEDSPMLTMMKKNPYRLTDEEYDDSYVHVEFKHGIKSWKQGDNILKTISHVLNIQPEMLSHQIYKPYSMSFKVEQNSRGWNSSELARRIAEINTILKEFEGVDVVSVAFGDEQNLHSIVMYPTEVKQNSSEIRPPLMKKEPRGIHPHNTEYEPPKSDEMDHIYVEFANDLKNWKQGSNIITNITNLLRLERWDLSEGKVRSNYVSFKVNGRVHNAKEVAKGIKMNQERLEELTGVQITSIGIGNKESIQTVISEPLSNDNEMYIVVFMICGILASVIITTALLFFIRKHIKSRDKLHSLTRTDPEISKDVVKTKAVAVAKPGDSVHGRITSLSRESEQSPSSRSSTSSWSEEPVFHNMDISTGHMVLSYMEDHLKNKDRLEQEWVALCAYVAEPCETSMAKKKENVDKNRYPDVVPYDHARIVLNELSNASGSDYINASSITDHDPRNPAYIATQGPLPHSTPDFWQLIWEQGAVVIVMLTRLTEGGAAMCHRYWPEEGSEVYHIYEVHLVSEHIWCDDYLVRSFYLKNIRTGETRTVTQFHFLSWPESGVPTSTKALLEFRRKVNKSYRGRSCPIVVHCSDGSGRTGTYCLIDMVLSRMAKGAKEIDIAATLEHLRDQRPKMVASKPQFEFVLTAVAEEVHAILKALPPQTTPAQEKEK